VLRLLAAAALAATFTRAGAAEEADSTARHFALVSAGDGVWAAIAKEGDRDSVGNAGFVVGSDAVLVVDTFMTPAGAEELAAEIRKVTPLPVRWVVNTHYHLDHVGGNAVFERAGAAVIAHENVRAWVRTENLKWRREITAEDREMLARLVLPDLTYKDGLTVWLGDRKVEVLFRAGHTGSDSIVVVPSSSVVFCGDLFWRETLPNLIDASTEAWVDTLDGFLQAYPASTFVPGHGTLGKALDVRMFREFLSALRLAVARGLQEGSQGQALVDRVLTTLRPRYGSWKWFDDFAARDVEWTEQETRGTKKLPKPAAP
jgi:glyoxylase-like metal-dependent hydrolase (beta-lactamase superfamily II)